MISEKQTWNIISDHFNKVGLVANQVETFNEFITHGIEEILTSSPLVSGDTMVEFSNVYIPYPTVTEDDRTIRDLFPFEARNRDLAYDTDIFATITEKNKVSDDNYEIKKVTHRVSICKLPIMLHSVKCHLSKLTKDQLIKVNECEFDDGGYFIIKGNERVLVSQLRSSYNIPFIFSDDSEKDIVCEMRSMSETTNHSVSTKITMEVANGSINVSLPYVKENIPIGIILKAMGCYKHEDILKIISLDGKEVNKIVRRISRDSYCNDVNNIYEYFQDTISGEELDKMTEYEKEKLETTMKEEKALHYIGSRSTYPIKSCEIKRYAKQVINIELFPHMGIHTSLKSKLLMIGYILNKIICTKLGLRKEDDRDNYSFKRVESPGMLCHELFNQLFKKFKDSIDNSIEKKKHSNLDLITLITRNNIITSGLRHCFSTGNWGVPKTSYIRPGVSQILTRLSYGATLSHKRRVCIPMGKESKNTKIRQINPSQLMMICPCETPEGQSVGIVLNTSITTKISKNTPTYIVLNMVKKYCEEFIKVDDAVDYDTTKVFINGCLHGFTEYPYEFAEKLRLLRVNKILNADVSISYNDQDDEIRILSDAGRLIRPVFTVNDNKIKIKESDGCDWDELVEQDIIRYLDSSEIENSTIAFNESEIDKYSCDYCEIAPALMLGVMGSIIPWPDHSQSPRNCYQTSMGKQAMSMYALTFKQRKDTIAHVLGYPQKPLVGTKIGNLMGFNDMPSGINVVVAIACYTGFNQEDSIIINKSAIDRGLFHATSYRTHTDQEKKHSVFNYEKIGNPPLDKRKMDWNYGLLDSNGIVMKRFPDGSAVYVDKGDVIVGKTFIDSQKGGVQNISDCSLVVKKGEEGYVDSVSITKTPDGNTMVKVIIRTEKIPEVGDKFASRAAQKGTCGMVYGQHDMPWTSDGISPDIIINPHCIPSRMTINQLMESVCGKVCALKGRFEDSTPFTEKSSNIANILCEQLEMTKYNKDGTEMLYNGFTGEPMGEVFMGIVYYQRLKHLVSEKIHARSTGPVTTLTRQPLEGRSRDGGLRFGEMERDCMISHGTSMFLKERLCDVSDPFDAPVCNKCGNISNTDTTCGICDSDSISKVGLPYVSKLVLQELNSMGIKTQITT